jgi:hypothetical protein
MGGVPRQLVFQVAKNGLHLHKGLLQGARFLDAGKEQGKLLAQASEELADAFQIRPPGPFRPFAQALGRSVGLAGAVVVKEDVA